MTTNKVKIIFSNGGFSDLEKKIKDWLDKNPKIKIVSVSHADTNTYGSVLIFYK
jgi:aspartate aminotransferase-like enzyme